MSYTKTLLAGAALCALCAAPALARTAPSIHLATSGFDSPSKLVHVKSNAGADKTGHLTLTYSFSASLSSADYKVPVQFIQYTWQDTATCIPPANEGMKITKSKKDMTAKIGVGTSTGPTSACPSSTFTFYGPLYELKSKTATSDSFKAALVAKHYSGYNDTLNEDWTVNITQ